MRLRDELGTTPGAALRALHGRLLADEPAPPDLAPREERKLVTVLASETEPRDEVERRAQPNPIRLTSRAELSGTRSA